MPHQVLQRLWIHASLRLVAAVGMSANVRRNLRHLYFENAVVSIDRMLESMFSMQRHLRHSILVSEKESHITIYHNLWKVCWSVLQNRLKHSVHIFRHRNLSRSGVCLRGFNVIFHIVESLKLMVDVDDAILHI